MNRNEAELERVIRDWYRPLADVPLPESLTAHVDSIPERLALPRARTILGGSRRLLALAAVLALTAAVIGGVFLGGGLPLPDSSPEPSPSGLTATEPTPTDPEATIPPPAGPASGKIVYSSSGQIMVMEADGSNPHALVEVATEAVYPTWSPDGGTLAYWLCEANCGTDNPRSFALILVDADGSNPRRLLGDVGWPVATSWSPDSTRIAYAAAYGPDGLLYGIFVVGVDGSEPKEIAEDFDVGWSPDGSLLAYGDLHIFVTDPAAGPGTSIFDEMKNATRANAGRVGDWSSAGSYHSWSPDGSKIVFHRRDNIFDFGNSILTTWVINRDGSNAEQLLGEGLEFGGWSPDGAKILYTQGGGIGAATLELTIANADRTAPQTITAPNGIWAWSPDGRLLLGIGKNDQDDPAGLTILDPTGAIAPVTIAAEAITGVSWQTLD